MHFSSEFLDTVRARVPISTLIGKFVQFDSKKTNAARGDYWACCPFHGEKTPSFHCEDAKQRFHCFGCGASGDHFRFLMLSAGLSFPEAVAQLTEMAGLTMPKDSRVLREQEKLKNGLYKTLEWACLFFERMLFTEGRHQALSYLKRRHIPDFAYKKFRLGYAPEKSETLVKFLESKGVTQAQMEQSGLIGGGTEGRSFARFRNRIIFPITDLKGRVIAFGSRALSAQAPAKYLNSPETELFHKGEVLYNLQYACQRVKDAALEKKSLPIFVVEGYIDVIALVSIGVENVVAPLGTALTEKQLQSLWRYTQRIVLCFDGDKAGLNAAYRVLMRALPLLNSSCTLDFIVLPNGKDPDDVVKEDGAEAMKALLKAPQTVLDLLWQQAIQGKIFVTPEDKARLEQTLEGYISKLKDKRLAYYYRQNIRGRLWELFSTRKNKVFQKGRSGKNNAFMPEHHTRHLALASGLHSEARATKLSVREALLLSLLARFPVLWEENFDNLSHLEFQHAGATKVYQAMLDLVAEYRHSLPDSLYVLLRERGISPSFLETIEEIVQRSGLKYPTEADGSSIRDLFSQALHLQQKGLFLKARLQEVEQRLLQYPDSASFAALRALKEELEANEKESQQWADASRS